jgi:hypothetical protein
MALYTFTVEGFHIDTTRARGDDTDQVAAVLRVGNETLPTQSLSTGDVDGGDFPIGMVFGPRLISQDNTAAVLSYSLYNGDTSKLPKTLTALTSHLVDKAVESMIKEKDPEQADPSDFTDFPDGPDNPDFNFEDDSWIKVLEFATLTNFLFPDCDDFVAMGTIGKCKKRWDTLIDAAGGATFRQKIRYPGTDSPSGCGSNSDYSVTWSVLRERVSGPGPHSLRQFLSSHHLAAQPSLRSLAPGEPSISVRGLMS